MSNDDEYLDRLLARGYLGGPRYDEIWRRIWRRAGGGPRSLAGPNAVSKMSWAVAVAVAVLAFVAGTKFESPLVREKGAVGSIPSSDAVEAGCGPNGSHVCAIGSVLMISVDSRVAAGFVVAYAERAGESPADRIWYFPTAQEQMPEIPAGQSRVVLPKGIRIGAEHLPGLYRLTVSVVSRPLDRSDLERAPASLVRARSTFELRIVERE